MTHAGRVVWEHEEPFTFRDACVASDGSVVGHAIASGPPLGEHEGELVVAILAPDGSIVGSERTLYEFEERGLHPYLHIVRLELCEERGCAAVEVSHARGADLEWRVYSVWKGISLGRSSDRPDFVTEEPPWKSRPAREPKHVSLDELPEVRLHPRATQQFALPGAPERELGFVAVDAIGRFLFVDQERFEAIAFDATGAVRLVARLADDDVGRGFASRRLLSVAARADGGLLVRVRQGQVEFAPDGTRLGRGGEERYLQPERVSWPGSREAWDVDPEGHILRLDAQGGVQQTIERGANDRWLRWLMEPSAARDGSLAVLDRAFDFRGDVWLHLFSAVGQPLRSVELPPEWIGPIAFDGRRVAMLVGDQSMVIIEADGTISGRALFPDLDEPDEIAFSPEGVLWVFTGATRHDYDLP
jgi:hypothetical protein